MSDSRRIKVERRGDCVVLDVEYPYEITLDRVPDHAALVEWIYHLSDKTWVDSRVISDFIYVVCNAKGWKIFGNHN